MGEDGIFHVYENEHDALVSKDPIVTLPTLKKYYQDQEYILSICSEGPTKSFAFRRLRYLESKFHMYVLLNEYQELADTKVRPFNLQERITF